MSKQFCLGKSGVSRNCLAKRIGLFLDDLQMCLDSLFGVSFDCFRGDDNLSYEKFLSDDELNYFVSWLRNEGFKNIKYILAFNAETVDPELESVLDNCILEDSKNQEDKEIVCENVADAVMYLSKAMKATAHSGDIPEKIAATYSSHILKFTRKMYSIRAGNNFEITESDLSFKSELPVAA